MSDKLKDWSVSRRTIRDNIKWRIRKMHSKDDNVAMPSDPSFISLPLVLCNIERNGRLLRCSTGAGISLSLLLVVVCRTSLLFIIYLDYDRIFIFPSNEQFGGLQSAQCFMSVGTFKVVPEIFCPLYITYTVCRDHAIPVYYALR